jgi:hypothetical protein
MLVSNLDYTGLLEDVALKNSFEEKLVEAVASETHRSPEEIAVVLSKSSFDVECSFAFPDSAAKDIVASLHAESLAAAVAKILDCVPGITSITTGVMSVPSVSISRGPAAGSTTKGASGATHTTTMVTSTATLTAAKFSRTETSTLTPTTTTDFTDTLPATTYAHTTTHPEILTTTTETRTETPTTTTES